MSILTLFLEVSLVWQDEVPLKDIYLIFCHVTCRGLLFEIL